MALATVFPDPYTFSLRFVERRNTTEADLIFSKNGNETDDLLNTGGGGVADIASFALRIALWSLKKSRATFILDEPDKFLHNPDYQEKASSMMKELCEKMGIQIILVSDQERIIAAADKVIRIENRNGVSSII
jgi:DNA repair exonuclease SbcCD ATPase subunit